MFEFDEEVYIIIEGKRVPLSSLDEENPKKDKEKEKNVDEPERDEE